jgi:hypothetical protein
VAIVAVKFDVQGRNTSQSDINLDTALEQRVRRRYPSLS